MFLQSTLLAGILLVGQSRVGIANLCCSLGFTVCSHCLQVKVKLNLHGVVGVESVQQVDEEEYEEKVKRPVVKVCLVA